MGVLVEGGDRQAIRRTAEFFLKSFQVRSCAGGLAQVDCRRACRQRSWLQAACNLPSKLCMPHGQPSASRI